MISKSWHNSHIPFKERVLRPSYQFLHVLQFLLQNGELLLSIEFGSNSMGMRIKIRPFWKRFIDYQSLLLCLKCFLEFQFQLLLFIHHFFLLLSVFLLFILIHLSQSHNHSNSNNTRFAYLQLNTLMEWKALPIKMNETRFIQNGELDNQQ